MKETGLPQTDVPTALLTFNLGVEAGQLLFVAAVWGLLLAARRLAQAPMAPARVVASYLIGAVSMLWFLDRIGSFTQGS